jgi:hemolysin III
VRHPPPEHRIRQPGLWELRLDAAIHIVAIAAGLAGTVGLLLIAFARDSFADVAVVALYSVGLLAMFGCSAICNHWQASPRHNLFRALDHSAIFLMIAGTYSPFTMLRLGAAWGWSLSSVVWSVAAAGIALRILHAGLFDRLSVALYLVLGWIGIIAIVPLLDAFGVWILVLLATGGVLYTIGVGFHLWERLPFQNAIWHAFVLAAAGTHYAAVAVSVAAPVP